MSQYIPRAIRQLVVARADHRCEYCRVPEYLSCFEYHIEHIIGIQHGGTNEHDNLAYCCSSCNWKKGPNISTILEMGGDLIPLFNPRKQNWFDHFETQRGVISTKTIVGQATAKLLEFNKPEKIEERFEMSLGGFYP
jgi:HNH endonuclease